MPVIVPTLAQLLETNIDANMKALGGNPLGQKNPSYFKNFCLAIATGIGSQATIQFVTVDAGSGGTPPVPGVGAGVGIMVDDLFMSEQIYTNLRNQTLAQFGRTIHNAWPDGPFLKALTDGISLSVKTHFATAWVLTSAHPLIYMGTGLINNGAFSGVSDSSIASAMAAAGGSLQGPYWPTMCQQIAKGFKDGIEQKSTGTVAITGVCIPLTPPAGFQLCGINMSGAGTGTAA